MPVSCLVTHDENASEIYRRACVCSRRTVEGTVYRSDVVGSLLRPAYLKEARDQFAGGKLSDAAFKRVEDRAVDECIDLQIRSGIEVITDGEVRRYAFYGHLIDAVEGFDKYGGWGNSLPD